MSKNRLLSSFEQNKTAFLRLARIVWIALAALTLWLDLVAIPVGYQASLQICTSGPCTNDSIVTPAGLERLHSLGLSLEFFSAARVGVEVVSEFLYAAVGLIIFWRRSDDPLALFGSFSLLTFGSVAFGTLGILVQNRNPWFSPAAFIYVIGQIVFAVFFFIFPDGRLVPRWSIFLLLIWSVGWLPALLIPGFSPTNSTIGAVGFVIFVIALIGSQVYRYYRVSDRVQKQQTKWVVLGFVSGLCVFITVVVLMTAIPALEQDDPLVTLLGNVLVYGAMLLIPLSFAFAILSSRLWDIDIIIRRTLIYAVLSAVLALFYFGSVVLLQQLLRALTGQESDIAVILSTLTIAALFSPLRHRVQRVIDHRFYRRKYDAAQVLARFAGAARDEVDLNQLTGELLAVVHDTMQPTHASLWLARRTQDGGRTTDEL